jgi:TPR repeat protein
LSQAKITYRFAILYLLGLTRRLLAMGCILCIGIAGIFTPACTADSRTEGIATIEKIAVQAIGDRIHIVVTADRNFQYRTDQAVNPHRVFFDLANTQVVAELNGKAIPVGAAGLDHIRIAQHDTNTTRLVFYIREGVPCSPALLSGPPRFVVDVNAGIGARQPAAGAVTKSAKAPPKKDTAVLARALGADKPSAVVIRAPSSSVSAKPVAAAAVTMGPTAPASVLLPSFARSKPPELHGGAGMNLTNPENGTVAPGGIPLRGAAQKGDPEAQFRLANMYVNGVGVDRDLSKAAEWYGRASAQGHALAQNNLGVMYANGWGVPQNFREALKLFVSASGQGNADAESNLGAMFLLGRGVDVNEAEAAFWLKRAAQQGVAEAEYSLGTLYFNGRGIGQDEAEALSWFREAADRGYVPAEVAIGKMYVAGRGVTTDYAQAMSHFRSAAERGSSDAAFQVALLYRDGRGVPTNQQEALAWLRKAAERGSLDGQYMLGQMYREGKAGTADLVSAYAWFAVAAANGNENAKQALNTIAPQMTLNQIVAGQTQAVTLASRVLPAANGPGAIPSTNR